MPWGSEWDRLALLHWSAVYNASESTEVALSSESTLDYRVYMIPFCLLNPCAHTLKVLLEYNATVDKLNSIKETPLHLAAGKGHAKVAKVNIQNKLHRLLRRPYSDSPRARSRR